MRRLVQARPALLVWLGHVSCPPSATCATQALRTAAAPRAFVSLSGARARQLREGESGSTAGAQASAAGEAPTPPIGSVVPERLVALARTLREAPDPRARALALVALGASSRFCTDGSEPLPEGAERVKGCTSVTYVSATVDAAGRAHLAGSSDAALSRGLLALVVDGLSGTMAVDVLRLTSASIRQLAALDGAVTPGRINGLDNILRSARAQLEAALRARADARDGGAGADAARQQPQEEATEGRAEGAASALAGLPALQFPGSPATAQRSALEAATVPLPPSPQPPLPFPLRNAFWSDPATASAANRPDADSVAVLLSGGVDSSVALHLLQQQGIPVRAYYLRVWLADELSDLSDCPWEEDWAFCEAVCDQLKVPLEAVSVQAEYWDKVVSYLVSESRAGRTPNPDVMCNSRIKFGVFLDSIGARFGRVASGHYARLRAVTTADGQQEAQLVRAVDRHKDQSYFLSSLSQAQLSRLSFPLGELPKAEVRALAAGANLPTSARKDSQGVCFLGRLQFDSFLEHHLGERPGPIVEWETGETIGAHRGIWFHTVGQRKGLVPWLSHKYAARGPWNVVAKDAASDTLLVSRSYAEVSEQRRGMEVGAISWTTGRPPCAPGGSVRLGVQVRHGDGSHEATLELGADATSARVRLERVDKGLAPGQFAAFYDGDVCLGAGVIERPLSGS